MAFLAILARHAELPAVDGHADLGHRLILDRFNPVADANSDTWRYHAAIQPIKKP